MKSAGVRVHLNLANIRPADVEGIIKFYESILAYRFLIIMGSRLQAVSSINNKMRPINNNNNIKIILVH